MISYNKALKKLAGQIVRTIKDDTTYRNIPFGYAQLDIHSDGENVLLAVKVLNSTKDAFNLREFQMPLSKLQKFLISDEMQNNSWVPASSIFYNDYRVLKQISTGIAEIVNDAGNKDKSWMFPFYDTLIVLKKKKSVVGAMFNGTIGFVPFRERHNEVPLFLMHGGFLMNKVNGGYRELLGNRSLDFNIYHNLTRNGFFLQNFENYKQVDENSLCLEVV